MHDSVKRLYKYWPPQVGQPNLEKSENLPERNVGKPTKTNKERNTFFFWLNLDLPAMNSGVGMLFLFRIFIEQRHGTARHIPPLCGTEHGPTVGTSQWPVEEKRVAGCLQGGDSVLSWLYGVPVIYHGPKTPMMTFLRFSLFQNPAAMSLKVDEHFRSLTNMWKVDFL